MEKEMKTERFQLMIEKSMLEAVDDWGHSKRIRSRAEALRILVRKGLEASQNSNEKSEAVA